jgi:hypothetical protein
VNLKNYETTHVILNPDNDSNLKHFHFHSSAWRWLHPIPTFSSPFSETLFRLAVLGLILLSLALSAHACGPGLSAGGQNSQRAQQGREDDMGPHHHRR